MMSLFRKLFSNSEGHEPKDPVSEFYRGVAYALGEGVEQDYQKALVHYLAAANMGHPEAQSNLGVMYSNGQGVERNDSEAAKWFLKAASQGVDDAQYDLGVMYANGRGVAQDFSASLKWSLAAAAQGHAGAKNTVAVIYQNGWGVPEDSAEGFKWMRESAEAGFPAAQYNLGRLLYTGEGGNRDLIQALKWLILASTSVSEAKKICQDMMENMDSASVATASREAAEFNLRLLSKCSAGSAARKRPPSAAFMKPVTPDEKLAKVVGDKPLPRTELTKKLWAYIRTNGLQDENQRTLINADEALQAVFNGKKQVSMFEMTKLVSGHVK